MRNARLKQSFRQYNDSGLVSKAEAIVLAFTDNANFPKPVPTLASVQSAITVLSDAIAAAIDGGRVKIAARKHARTALEELLLQLNAYATMIAMGDRTILSTCGFDMYQEPQPFQGLEVSEPPMLTSGANTGEVLVKVPTVKGSKSYVFEYTADPLTDTSVWQGGLNNGGVDTRAKCLVTGLQAGKRYWFRVIVIGLRGSRTVSKAVSYIVQ